MSLKPDLPLLHFNLGNVLLELGSPDKAPIGRTVDPGDSIDISLELVAPGEPGTYRGQWQLSTTNGELFGTKPYVQIIVP